VLLQEVDEGRLFRACELLTLFLLELAAYNRASAGRGDIAGSDASKSAAAITFIQNNLKNPALNIDAIAAYMHYSRSRAMNVFKREIGMTIHEFIARSKIDCACDLLPTNSITEVAQTLNFSSTQYFSKVFKDHTGMTPTEYVQFGKTGNG